jgi:hypothetical protein
MSGSPMDTIAIPLLSPFIMNTVVCARKHCSNGRVWGFQGNEDMFGAELGETYEYVGESEQTDNTA